MMTHQTIDKLITMKLQGMADALVKQSDTPDLKQLSFDDRFGLLVDAEFSARENEKLKTRLKQASLRQNACFEDIDLHSPRGVDRTTLLLLSQCNWVTEGLNILIDGKTGVGKTYLATALAHKACRSGFTALYFRAPRLFQDLTVSRLGNRYSNFLKKLAKVDVVVLDDFALAPITDEQSRDLLEVVDDRAGRRPIIIASQLPPDNWYGAIPSATIADAILDRIIHGSHKLHLSGDTRRKPKPKDEQQNHP
ncbi:MAG: IS21-like element helper ATPase IstB [Candidatus Micrarchaeaceae archaeon]